MWGQIRWRERARNTGLTCVLLSLAAASLVALAAEPARANGVQEIEANIQTVGPKTTRADELTFRIKFREGPPQGEVLTGLDVDDIVVTGFSDNGNGPGATAVVTGVEPVLTAVVLPEFLITVGGGNLDDFTGQVGLGFAPNAQVSVGSQPRKPAVYTHVNEAYTLDNAAPFIRSIIRQNPSQSLTNAPELVFRVGFNEQVKGGSEANFEATGDPNATIVSAVLANNKTSYDVTVSGGDQSTYEGQVGLKVIPAAGASVITDVVGNPLANPEPNGDNAEFTVDRAGPRLGNVRRQSPANTAITNENAVVFRLQFIGAANDVDTNDFIVTGGSAATVTNVQKVDAFRYDLTVSGGDLDDFDGEVGLTFASNPTITDEIGNPLTDTVMPKGINETFTLDNTNASVTIRSQAGNTVGGGPFTVTITFDEPVTGFTEDEIDVTNAELSDFDGPQDGYKDTYSVTVTPDGGGDVELSVAADVARDEAGNGNDAAQPLTVKVDTTGATVRILDAPGGFVDLEPFAIRIVFSEPVVAFDREDLSVQGGKIVAFQGNDALYTAMIEPAGNADITLSVAAGVAFDALDNPNAASGIVTVANGISERTRQVIADFLSARANHIVSNPADLTGLLTGTGRGNLDARGDDDGFALNFAARLGVDGSVAGQRIDSAFGARPDAAGDRRFDIWTQVSGAFSSADGADGDFFVGYAGAHYFVSPDILVGTMVQLDWSEHVDGVATVEGRGWMVGPYVVARTPDQSVAFEARTAWGRSHNTVSPSGTYEDDFDTDRWLATAELSGAFGAGALTFVPSARVSYFRERQQAYTDGLGNDIAAQTLELGELRFGPGFAHDASLGETVRLRTQLGVSGVWNFDVGPAGSPAAAPAGTDRLRARIDGQARFTDARGPSVVATGFYDGIGAGAYRAWGGGVRFVVPFGDR